MGKADMPEYLHKGVFTYLEEGPSGGGHYGYYDMLNSAGFHNPDSPWYINAEIAKKHSYKHFFPQLLKSIEKTQRYCGWPKRRRLTNSDRATKRLRSSSKGPCPPVPQRQPLASRRITPLTKLLEMIEKQH